MFGVSFFRRLRSDDRLVCRVTLSRKETERPALAVEREPLEVHRADNGLSARDLAVAFAAGVCHRSPWFPRCDPRCTSKAPGRIIHLREIRRLRQLCSPPEAVRSARSQVARNLRAQDRQQEYQFPSRLRWVRVCLLLWHEGQCAPRARSVSRALVKDEPVLMPGSSARSGCALRAGRTKCHWPRGHTGWCGRPAPFRLKRRQSQLDGTSRPSTTYAAVGSCSRVVPRECWAEARPANSSWSPSRSS